VKVAQIMVPQAPKKRAIEMPAHFMCKYPAVYAIHSVAAPAGRPASGDNFARYQSFKTMLGAF
jgi:hypothetical protein